MMCPEKHSVRYDVYSLTESLATRLFIFFNTTGNIGCTKEKKIMIIMMMTTTTMIVITFEWINKKKSLFSHYYYQKLQHKFVVFIKDLYSIVREFIISIFHTVFNACTLLLY